MYLNDDIEMLRELCTVHVVEKRNRAVLEARTPPTTVNIEYTCVHYTPGALLCILLLLLRMKKILSQVDKVF